MPKKKIVKNPDGTHTIKGGFSNKNPEDMKLIKEHIRKNTFGGD